MMVSGLRILSCVLVVYGSVGCGSSSSDSGDGPSDPVVKPSKAGSAGQSAGDAPGGSADSGAGSTVPDGGEPTVDGGSVMMIGPLPKTIPSARGLCNLHTKFPGDDACLGVPDPDKGFQIHIGPDDYDDPAQIAKFSMKPGAESSECYMKKMPNMTEVLYLVYELSGRPGTHHIINTLRADDLPEDWGRCVSFAPGGSNLGSIGGASKSHMPPMPIAPENENLGIPLAAHIQAQHDMHYFNLTDAPILREFWMNLYYVKADGDTIRPNRIAGLGGLGWNTSPILPGVHTVFSYECPISADGRIIQLLGHTHAHGIRETAHIRHKNGERMKVFEQFDYLEPQIFMYDSLTRNPAFADGQAGAKTGLLEVVAGDVLEWECEVNNDSKTALRYVNEVKTGEMCNIWGMSVGPAISCFLQ
jgi:hypothetical protein